MIKLGINIDHVATVREARKGKEPDPVMAALAAEAAGSDTITVHLREDRRHIQDADVFRIKEAISIPLNLEMAVRDEMIDIALKVNPHFLCFVPENRQEITTEGGLEVSGKESELAPFVKKAQAAGIQVSLFIDPVEEEVRSAKAVGADIIEIHTGAYANAKTLQEVDRELLRISVAARLGNELGLIVNAGHGLNYKNVRPLLDPSLFNEFNIGHSVISRAIFEGLGKSVAQMKSLLID